MSDPFRRFGDLYEYDVNRSELKYGTDNNRLMKIERWQLGGIGGSSASSGGTTLSSGDPTLSSGDPTLSSGDPTLSGEGPMAAAGGPGGGGSGDTKLWTKYYYYSDDGDVFEDEGTIERIVTNFQGSNVYTAYRLGYAANGRTVTHVLGEQWESAVGYAVTFAREFRYDGARQRYMNRELDPTDLDIVLSETWSDYDGDEIHGDFEMIGSTQSELRSYEPGIGEVDPWTGGGISSTTYYHTNALGSTMGLSTFGGAGSFDFVYTAFGEQIMGDSQRFGYAGAWSYQSHDAFPFMHLGARYYNPTTGRFLQRDPIGTFGGLNVYAYVENAPTIGVDPEGLQRGTVRPGMRPPRTPITPPGFMKFPQQDTPFPDMEPPSTAGNAAVNLVMICTGGPYIPNGRPPGPPGCISCSHYDGDDHFHAGRPGGRGGGHPIGYPLGAAAFVILTYALASCIGGRRLPSVFETQ